MSKYTPLRRHLANESGPSVTMTFVEIDELVGGLPDSARRYRAWWSNERDGSHVQAHAWMETGLRVARLDMAAQLVRFTKT